MKMVFPVSEPKPLMECTSYIQSAIDACAENGGGQVRLKAGIYTTGTLYLKTGVELYLDAGAVLRGTDELSLYSNACPGKTMVEGVPQWYNALITAVDAHDVAISGEGVLDGTDCLDEGGEQGFRGPHTVFFCNCRKVSVQGVMIVRSACYSLMFESCEDVYVGNVNVRGGQDGIRLGACRNVHVTGCDIRSGDDCVGGSGDYDILIEKSSFNTPAGSALQLSCCNLLVKNCIIWSQGLYPAVFKDNRRYSNCYSAIATGLDYGYDRGEESRNWKFENVVFENIEMLFRFESDAYGRVPIHLHDVVFDNIKAVNLTLPSIVKCADGSSPMKIEIKNSLLSSANESAPFIKGNNFELLAIENTVLEGWAQEEFELVNINQLRLTNVQKRPLAGGVCGGTLADRLNPNGEATLYAPNDTDEAFRGPAKYIPFPYDRIAEQ